jgi:hypothetical protein
MGGHRKDIRALTLALTVQNTGQSPEYFILYANYEITIQTDHDLVVDLTA